MYVQLKKKEMKTREIRSTVVQKKININNMPKYKSILDVNQDFINQKNFLGSKNIRIGFSEQTGKVSNYCYKKNINHDKNPDIIQMVQWGVFLQSVRQEIDGTFDMILDTTKNIGVGILGHSVTAIGNGIYNIIKNAKEKLKLIFSGEKTDAEKGWAAIELVVGTGNEIFKMTPSGAAFGICLDIFYQLTKLPIKIKGKYDELTNQQALLA
ncbi:hypothetical protein GCM10007938_29950 [Vibrio zhanjiangensis]|uniref:Uncharacterized protein n=1 Tax=Vibrio zhanjiangensis TaxID=1046128 RepID=A0ABQ6F140_9VIBR|nr:hypothetical protein [Vibrio zhanjiangensis]GLT19213.1 hypothetical protein GCM10007938_29950 [Vibrio zhanjiangensis]